MRKGSDVVGKPVVTFDTGERIERVQDLLFDQNSNQLLGFVVDEGGWFSGARVLPLNRVQAIGPDTLIVPDRKAVIPAEQDPVINTILARNNVLRGTRIVTTDGKELGTLVDLYFDEQTGAVEGYEVSGGMFADAVSGRAFVPAPHTLKIGEDVAFVPPETVQLMEEQVGGLRGAVSSTMTNTVVDSATQRQHVIGRVVPTDLRASDGTLLIAQGQAVTPEVAVEAERRGALADLYRATGGSLTSGAEAAVAGRTVEQTAGRRVHRLVQTDQGLIIAAPGQIVTEQVINRARTYGKEAELMEATGLSAGEAISGATSGVATSAGAAVREGTQSIKEGAQSAREGAANLWDRVKSRLSESQESAAQEAEQRRISYAVGRPVTRVILDPQDNVILNVGEIITHQAVERSRSAGVLDMLLSSVYDKDPEIDQAELRAPEPGAAALEQQNKAGA